MLQKLWRQFALSILSEEVELRRMLCNAQYFVLPQGFSKDIRMQKSSYIGYIKDYEGATLMHVSTSYLTLSAFWYTTVKIS